MIAYRRWQRSWFAAVWLSLRRRAAPPRRSHPRQRRPAIPIVFTIGTDPVKIGLVASLNRPGGNATGISDFGVEMGAKRLGLLHELLPGAARFGVLVNTDNPVFTESFVTELQPAASAIGREIEVVTAKTNSDIDAAFPTLVKKRADALLISPDPLFTTRRVQLIMLAVRHALPALYHRREITEAGGLMSYGADLSEQYRQTGVYVGRILKGEKPAEMPVQLPTRFEFVIDLQTARTIALDIPPTLLARRRRGDRIERLLCCICSRPVMAQSGVSLRCECLAALGGEADIRPSRGCAGPTRMTQSGH